jgi:hypothetical protein
MTFGSPVLRFAQRTELQRDCETRIVEFDSAAMEIACAGLQGGRLRVTRAGVTGLAEPSVVSSRGTRTLNIHLSAQPPLEKAELLAVGSAPELGAWDPQRGAVLHGSSLSVDVPDGAVYEFKFVKRRADRSVEWESRDDRFVFVPPGTGALNLEAAWNES